MSSVPRVCSACGAACSWDARFCQNCGRSLDDRTPRYYGVLSPGPAFALGCVVLVLAVVAFVAGSLAATMVLLAVAVAAFAFFYDAARRHPEDRVARGVSSSGSHLRGWGRFAIVAVAAWWRAARTVVRLRRESRSLRREREPILRSLGDAAYREDEPLVKTLRERIGEIDGEVAKREEARADALAAARRHVDEERGAAQPTEQLSVDDIASGGKSDDD